MTKNSETINMEHNTIRVIDTKNTKQMKHQQMRYLESDHLRYE